MFAFRNFYAFILSYELDIYKLYPYFVSNFH